MVCVSAIYCEMYDTNAPKKLCGLTNLPAVQKTPQAI
jgi:hypothetical protein